MGRLSHLLTASLALVSATTVLAAPAQHTTRDTSFSHPGVFLDSAQLDFIKTQVSSQAEPWSSAFTDMLNHEFASRTSPTPHSTVECGPTSTPDIGCHDEREDALTAYLNALAWVVTGTQSYADRAIQFMNGWAQTLTGHTNSNAPLQTGWAAASWARAAEIIRYTDAGWSESDIGAFEALLRDVYLPELIGGSDSNGNWELVMMEAAIGISVFINDQDSYDTAMGKFLDRVPAYIYLTSDGDIPQTAPIDNLSSDSAIIGKWYGQSTFPENGIAQETCRDFTHTGYGLASIGHVAETSRIQGRDLFQEDTGTRLRYGLGFHTRYEQGESVPGWLCGGRVNLGLGPVTEVGFNAMSYRLGYGMTNTEAYTLGGRPAGTDYLFVGWETLTNAMNDA